MFRKLKNFLSNIRWYWKVILNDYDYDYHFIYILLDKKLEKMEKYFRSDKSVIEDNHRVADEINQTRKYLKILIDEEYLDDSEESKIYLELQGKIEKYTEENNLNYLELLFPDHDKKLELPKDVKNDLKRLNAVSGRYFKQWSKFMEKTKKDFFDSLNDNIENWWD